MHHLKKVKDIQQRLSNSSLEQKLSALLEVLEFGEEGFTVAKEFLLNQPFFIQLAAFSIINQKNQLEIKYILQNTLLWRIFEYVLCLNQKINYSYILVSLEWGLLLRDRGDYISVWDLLVHQEILKLSHPIAASKMLIAPDGKTLISANYAQKVAVWDLLSGAEIDTLQHENLVCAISITANGNLLATSTGRKIWLWNFETKQLLSVLTEVAWGDAIYALAISPDGEILISGNRSLTAWNLSTREVLYILPDVRACQRTQISFAADGQTFLFSNGEVIEIRDLRTGVLLKTLQRHYKPTNNPVNNLDGRIILSINEESQIKIWDLVTEDTWIILPYFIGKERLIDIRNLKTGKQVFKGAMPLIAAV